MLLLIICFHFAFILLYFCLTPFLTCNRFFYFSNIKEGDVIDKDTVLYKSTSYDDDMKYAYGKNITTMYTLDPYTSEDAAIEVTKFCALLCKSE